MKWLGFKRVKFFLFGMKMYLFCFNVFSISLALLFLEGRRWLNDFVYFSFWRKFEDFKRMLIHCIEPCSFSLSSSSFNLSLNGYTSLKLIEECLPLDR